MKLYTLDQIRPIADAMDFSAIVEQGFVAFSRGDVVTPPVGEMTFDAPPGDTHIKYGYIKNDDVAVIKIASGFYDNPQLGLPSNSGLMLVLSQKTGAFKAILLDEGYLTDVRTAVAGQIAAKYLAPSKVTAIGVLGLGIQGKKQVEYLKSVTECRQVVAWGRSGEKLAAYAAYMSEQGFSVEGTQDVTRVCEACNLIVTTTPSQAPLLEADMIRPGTHITAMGSDTPQKQELAPALLAKADVIVVDSVAAAQQRGESFQAIAAGCIAPSQLRELGAVIAGAESGRTTDDQITVADLTGIAIQDIQLAKAVVAALTN